MIKIIYKSNPELNGSFSSFDELADAFSTVASICNHSIMSYVLEHYNLYVDGVEFVC